MMNSNDMYVVHDNMIYRKARSPKLSELLDGPIDVERARSIKEIKRKKKSVYVTKQEECVIADLDETRINGALWRFMDVIKRYFDRHKENWFYNRYRIPKQNGKLRIIEEPSNVLRRYQKDMLTRLLDIHQCRSSQAFAYAKDRNIVDALKRHTYNKSRWYLKLDLHDFFGSTDCQTIIEQMTKVYPFTLLKKMNQDMLKTYIKTIFLNKDGVLPQGAPTSPLISNLIMIPFDYEFSKWCRENNLIYTRYADDMIISSKDSFDWRIVTQQVEKLMGDLNLPYQINKEKTRYGSYKGKNWNLGLMCNGDYKISLGHNKKKEFKAMLTKIATEEMSQSDKDRLNGIISYYLSIEKEYINYLIEKYNKKFGIDILAKLRK